ncbi:MAG: orotate phosphoribosyltransferase [Pseudomonadota bacterium]
MERKDLAKAILDVAHLTGEFLLRSGRTSNEYFDKYQFEARPHLLDAIAEQMIPHLPENFDLLGAMEMGGIPIATAIALKTEKEMVFIRKEAKEYGTCKFSEGPDIKGKKICLIEDVITTGGQVVISTGMLRDKEAIVENVVAVIDRSLGDHSKLQGAGLSLKALFTMDELKSSH